MVQCPFCNFETEYPADPGKVYECQGECYSTYGRFGRSDTLTKAKMRLVEIFFLDSEFNVNVGTDDLEQCEFQTQDAATPEHLVLFARESRLSEMDIERLRGTGDSGPEFQKGMVARLRSSVDRFERALDANAQPKILLNQARVLTRMAEMLRASLEKKMDPGAKKDS